MTIYVSPSSKKPIEDAIANADASGYQTDANGREYYLQAKENGKGFDQIYCDDEHGDDTVSWTGGTVGRVTPANTLEVTFSC